MNPFFCKSRFGAPKIANCRFQAIRANRKGIDSCESPQFALRIAKPSKFHTPTTIPPKAVAVLNLTCLRMLHRSSARCTSLHSVATRVVDELLDRISGQERHSGKKEAHKHKFFCPVALGTTPGLSQGQTQVVSLYYTVEGQFIPGTNPVCPCDNPGDEGRQKNSCVKSLCAFLAR